MAAVAVAEAVVAGEAIGMVMEGEVIEIVMMMTTMMTKEMVAEEMVTAMVAEVALEVPAEEADAVAAVIHAANQSTC